MLLGLHTYSFHLHGMGQNWGGYRLEWEPAWDIFQLMDEAVKLGLDGLHLTAADKGTTYLDARKDLVAALKYAHAKLTKGPVIAWGSSYSAGLVLEIAGDHPDLVDGVLAFSPGEYFTRFGKSNDWVKKAVAGITAPVFITSARSERDGWQAIYKAIPGPKASFVPNTKGNHGSRALWAKFDDSAAYRAAVEQFMTMYLSGKGTR